MSTIDVSKSSFKFPEKPDVKLLENKPKANFKPSDQEAEN